jgi:hypothetical protein
VLPVRALAQPSTLEVLEHEEFVTGVLDESGVPLSLLFNDLTGGFYYILNEEIGATERLIPVEGDENCLIGERTRFVYLREPEFGRTLLVGVDAANIQANNYFDGPFDQVPPRLQIKEKLERAYPYTLLRGGIDDHGNFRELEHQRVAISPYQTYQSVAAAAESIREHIAEALLPSERWDRLTYESKRRSPTTQAAMNEGIDVPQYVAQGWPANHWGYTSALWPATHQAAHSGLWPANHTAQTSAR